MITSLSIGTLSSCYVGTDSTCNTCNNELMVLAQKLNNDFSKRLRMAVASAGWEEHGSQTRLAEVAGTTPKAANKWMNGEAQPRRDKLRLIAAALGVKVSWLEYGDVAEYDAAPRKYLSVREPSPDQITINQYNTGGRGGAGLVLRDQPGVIEEWTVSKDWLRANLPHYTNASALAIVTGFGDSMPEVYSPGDPVLVDTGVTQCDHDGIYFFRVGDEGFIKRLQRIPGQGIRVLSQNPEYEAWTVTPDMDFAVMGKVLRAWMGKNY